VKIEKKNGRATLTTSELEELIFKIDLMLTEDVSELFTTPEEK
jgi:hypothetical protein